jgi:hypothetical protein
MAEVGRVGGFVGGKARWPSGCLSAGRTLDYPIDPETLAMRTRNTLLAAAAIVALGACKKTPSGDIVVDKPTGITTTQDTLHPPTITTKTDTISTPVVGTQKDTIVVNKPVVGSKKTEVKVPVIKKKP